MLGVLLPEKRGRICKKESYEHSMVKRMHEPLHLLGFDKDFRYHREFKGLSTSCVKRFAVRADIKMCSF